MAVPDFQSYMAPMLQLMTAGQPRRITEISQAIAQHFELNPLDLEDLIPSGKKSRHYDRVGWSATYMKQAGLLISPKRGWYQIAERGIQAIESNERIDTQFLRRFPEFLEFQLRTRDSVSTIGSEVIHTREIAIDDHTPDEVLESASQTLRNALAIDLLERVKESPPQFFEQLVIDLLLAMGYGGSQRDAAQRVGQSGDGGIDGIINEDRLGLDVIYIQAKRWESSVGARDVRDFAGSLEEKKAIKGVFITTSDFTKDAREFVGRIGKRIILIDGQRLADLLIDFNVGVGIRKTYIIKKIDEDYFADLES
jgi:restriction system protein